MRLYLLYQLWDALSVEDPRMIDRYLQALTPSYLPQPRTSRHSADRTLRESINTYTHGRSTHVSEQPFGLFVDCRALRTH